MAIQTAVFDDQTNAHAAIRDLRALGMSEKDLSVIGPGDTNVVSRTTDTLVGGDADEDFAEKTAAGAMVGGLAGMTAGIATMAIPGIGPVAAAGAIGGALIGSGLGTATGSLVAIMTDHGVDQSYANQAVDAIKDGKTVVIARSEDARAEGVDAVLRRHDPTDVDVETAGVFASDGALEIDDAYEEINEKPREDIHTHERQRTAEGTAAHDIARGGKRAVQRKRERDEEIDDTMFGSSTLA